jgi:FlaA1/EpsC-like NDP-sugar epimerase
MGTAWTIQATPNNYMPPGIQRLALQRTARLFDLVVVSFSFLVVLAIDTGDASWPNIANVFAMRITVGNVVSFALYLVLCRVIFSSCGLYRSHRLSVVTRRAGEIALAVGLITAIILVLRAPLELSFAKNSFLLLFGVVVLVSLMLSHEAALRLLYYARSRGRNLRHIVIVGEPEEAGDLAQRIAKDSTFGYHVVGVIHPGGSRE